MNYENISNWYYETDKLGSKLGLEAITVLLSKLNNPQKKLRTIHITGTNGKGSTAAMIASILISAGFKVGLFTKPHLSTFLESIKINNQLISEDDATRILLKIKINANEMETKNNPRHPTQFEILTALAFTYFAEQETQFAIIEAGMGGLLDATNVIDPLIAIITNVSLEHTNVLGETKLEIASNKAGIIKENCIVVTATEDKEIFQLLKDISNKKFSNIIRVGKDITYRIIKLNFEGLHFIVNGKRQSYELFTKLLGEHQAINAATAIAAIESLKKYGYDISESAIIEGIKDVKWPGRLEVVSNHPLIVLDGAKDEAAVKALTKSLSIFDYKHLILIIGISSDKNISKMVEELAKYSDFIIATNHRVKSRSTDPQIIAKEFRRVGKNAEISQDFTIAFNKAVHIAQKNDLILITGSLFLVGEAREIILKNNFQVNY
ncbi:bifunctional folylpolyglutamate synthase/dihydrofolate synthase [Candidatus Bathyarchaeota archaeon]|nr:bifunctional folylpolyglutamate synthase/dihydrofolate synthase [Candidatus Bathyarchaeota archaeon]